MKDEKSLSWARELAEALQAWCKQEGLTTSKLAKILGVRESIWYSITSGRSMSADVQNYAKVYLWTGLPEADPRTVPLQKLGGVAKGKVKVRAWNDKQFNQWLNHSVAQKLLRLKLTSGNATEVVKQPSVNDQTLEGLVEKLVVALKPDVVANLTSSELMRALLRSIQSVLNGTSKERDNWFKQNREVLVELVPLLEILSQGSADREHALDVIKRT